MSRSRLHYECSLITWWCQPVVYKNSDRRHSQPYFEGKRQIFEDTCIPAQFATLDRTELVHNSYKALTTRNKIVISRRKIDTSRTLIIATLTSLGLTRTNIVVNSMLPRRTLIQHSYNKQFSRVFRSCTRVQARVNSPQLATTTRLNSAKWESSC